MDRVEVVEFYRYEEVENDCIANPHRFYVFGDNFERVGRGGQAVIRPLRNAVGLATKYSPSMSEDAFFSDKDFDMVAGLLDKEVNKLIQIHKRGYTIVFPKAGLGTGLSAMPVRCPRLFDYLCDLLMEHFGFDNRGGA